MNIQGFLSEELWLFIVLALVIALAVPGIGMQITPYTVYFLLAVMFLTCLEISFGELRRVFVKEKRLLIITIFLVYVVGPVVAFMLSPLLESQLALGLILYSAMPAAMTNAFYVKMLGKNATLSLMATAITTLMAPFAAPIIVKLLAGIYIEIDALELFTSLIKLVILPFIAAELVRRYAKRVAGLLLKNAKPLGNICVFFVIIGVVSSMAGGVWGLGLLAAVMVTHLLICYALGHLSSKQEGVSIGFSSGFRNSTLAMVVGLEVFGPAAAIPGVMAYLIRNVTFVPMAFWAKRK